MQQKFTVIIPTLNRAETLESALRTCLIQDYANFEIIVSDNASDDHTAAIAKSFDDPRIRYINPGSRLGMSEHWDFALSHVSDGFVTVLGDDDGILPGAIDAINAIIESTGANAVTWRKVEYCWPQHIIEEYRHYLEIPLDESLETLDSGNQVKRVLEFQLPYNCLPCIYNSFISLRAVGEFKKSNGGLMFTCLCPDIFSGFAIASVVDRYAFSARPFSINGAGSKSNGTAAFHEGVNHPIVKKFFADTKYKLEEGLSLEVGEFYILDAFLKVAKVSKTFPPAWVDNSRLIESALGNIAAAARSDNRHETAIEAIGAFASRCGLQERFDELKLQSKRTPTSGRLQAPGLHESGRRLILNGFNLRIENVFDAARRVEEILKLKAGRPALFRELCETKTPEIAIPLCACADRASIRFHLGCGEQHLPGYVNIDYPPSEHSVMHVKADLLADITKFDFPDGCVDEIRLHHVFEHFNRVTALAMLIRWQGWLKIGGILRIETPDIMGSARILVTTDSHRVRMGIVRHLAGDQAAEWAYHVDHWFPERFEHTLRAFGFASIQTRSWNWEQPPFLSNVEVTARKDEERALAEQLKEADQLLWESTVADVEKSTHEVWKHQLRSLTGPDQFNPLPDAGRGMPKQAAQAANMSLAVTDPKVTQQRGANTRRGFLRRLERSIRKRRKLLMGHFGYSDSSGKSE